MSTVYVLYICIIKRKKLTRFKEKLYKMRNTFLLQEKRLSIFEHFRPDDEAYLLHGKGPM